MTDAASGSPRLRVAFVYPNPRGELVREAAAGVAPDTALLGQNHLAAHGVDAVVREPRLRRGRRARGVRHRLSWTLREVTLPWEVGAVDAVVTPVANLLPLAARLRPGLRVVLFDWAIAGVHGRQRGLRRRVVRASARAADAILSPGETQRQRLLAAVDVDPVRVHVVPLGADESWFEAAPPAPAGPVLSVGKDLARDYGTLGAALRTAGGEAVVVAEPRNLVGVELPPWVRVARRLPWAELRDLYRQAGVVVVPLRPEGRGVGSDGSGLTALLEAMACARPIVASRRPPLVDYVEDGVTGLLVPAGDPDALAAAIARLRGDPELAARLGAAARAAVEERFTTRALAARLAAVLHDVCGR